MKILIDTNVLISAALWPKGACSIAYQKAVAYPNCAVISEANVEELHRVFTEKFPDKIDSLDAFLSVSSNVLEIIPVPKNSTIDETVLRDENDQPILRAAIVAGVDLILTGDKDFLETDLKHPLPISPKDFIEQY